jgi:lysozyme
MKITHHHNAVAVERTMTMIVNDIVSQLRRDEGERLSAYQDSLGYWTIGIGRLIDARRGGAISQEESALLLTHDLAKIAEQLHSHLPWTIPLDDARYGVLLNMAFNLGFAGLVKFHNMLTAMQAKDWETAAKEMLNSAWAGQVGERATRLAAQVRSGIWQ